MNTPENLKELKDNEIFVFGSNVYGSHYSGAAKDAKELFGAEMGVGIGMTGKCYAIPTLDEDMQKIELSRLKGFINDFINYAECHSDLTFILTKIGCGIAGFSEDDIKVFFKNTPKNIIKPEGW